jgi:hypothetical protein
MATTVTIGGSLLDLTLYRWAFGALEKSLDEADTFDFSEYGMPPIPTWQMGQAVEVTVDGETKPTFRGRIVSIGRRIDANGWNFAYRCLGLRYLINRIAVTSNTFTGSIIYNRSKTDTFYNLFESGLTLGDMLTLVLDLHRDQLWSMGVGTPIAPAPSTGATYVPADLTATPFSIVPKEPVPFTGPHLFNAIDMVLQHWAGNVACYVEYYVPTSDWRIRFIDTTAMPTIVTITLDDPVNFFGWEPPSVTSDITECYTRVAVRSGQGQIEPAFLSLKDGTLAPAWTAGEQTAWNWSAYANPSDAVDSGTISTLTSVTASCISSDKAETWVLNQWSAQKATVFLINPAATGINIVETRIVSSNSAKAAGATGTLDWSLDRALDAAGYTHYHIVGAPGGTASDVYRLFDVIPPAVRDHMTTYFPFPIHWAINGTIIGVVSPVGAIFWNTTGYPPDAMMPAFFEIDRANGQIRFTEPTIKAINKQSDLDTGGSSVKQLDDLVAVIPFSKGPLESPCPSDAYGGVAVYSGTAYTDCGITETYYEDIDTWIDPRDTSSMHDLACMRLETMNNVNWDGSVRFRGRYNAALTMGLAINFTGNGYTTGLEAINGPVRKVRLIWPPPGESTSWDMMLSFNSRRRMATGEANFIHPAFRGGTFGFEGGDVQVGTFGTMHAENFGGMGFGSDMVRSGAGAAMGGFERGAQQAMGGFEGQAASALGGIQGAGQASLGGLGGESAAVMGGMQGQADASVAAFGGLPVQPDLAFANPPGQRRPSETQRTQANVGDSHVSFAGMGSAIYQAQHSPEAKMKQQAEQNRQDIAEAKERHREIAERRLAEERQGGDASAGGGE